MAPVQRSAVLLAARWGNCACAPSRSQVVQSIHQICVLSPWRASAPLLLLPAHSSTGVHWSGPLPARPRWRPEPHAVSALPTLWLPCCARVAACSCCAARPFCTEASQQNLTHASSPISPHLFALDPPPPPLAARAWTAAPAPPLPAPPLSAPPSTSSGPCSRWPARWRCWC